MKKISLLTLLLAIATMSFSQKKETTLQKFYAVGGIGSCSNNGVASQLGLQAMFKKNWSASLSYYNVEMNPKNLPANYEPGYTTVFILPFPDAIPANEMSIVNLTAGKYFEAGRRVWFTAEAGISVATGDKFEFTSQPIVYETSYFFAHQSSNYATHAKKETSIGGMLKADFNWAFLPWVGLGAGVYANFNSIQSPIGFQIMLTAGWMNLKKKH